MENGKGGKQTRSSRNECVQVVVRCRPLNEKEKLAEDTRVVDVWPSRGVIEILNPKDPNRENKKTFTYDAVYDWFSTQQNLYDETVRPLVSSVLEGFNGCVFAYGQTGTGKTYTMEGVRGELEELGMIPKAFEQIWMHINRTNNTQFLVSTSYLEIYMEEIRDLLKVRHQKTLELRENEIQGVHVPNLHTVNCKSAEDMLKVMMTGNKNRSVGCTNMNEHSSRSHAIFQISIEMCDIETNLVRVGKLNLIDLAGSERQSKTGATALRLKEASKINRALSSLGNVISALAEHSAHIPYRDSKLSRLLQDSLGGNSKTIMIANVGPASSNYEETLTTLRYAHRAKAITNKPVKNEDPKDAKLREYQQEIARLKELIAERRQAELDGQFAAGDSLASSATETDNEDDTSDSNGTSDYKFELEKTIEIEKMKTDELRKKLRNLEKQFVRGGKNIFDSVNDAETQIEERMLEIAARKKREREMQQKLELEEETTSGLRETFTTLQQELEYKNNKLNKIHNRWLALKQEQKDLKEEHIRDRRELEQTQEDLVKQLKLKCILLDNFIPPDIRVKLFSQVEFNEDLDDWVLLPKQQDASDLSRHLAKPNNRRPLTDYAIRKANTMKSMNKYRIENICDLEFDQPVSMTKHYTVPAVSPDLQAIIKTYYTDEISTSRMEVQEPPQSFQPRLFARRDLEKRYERATKSLIDIHSTAIHNRDNKVVSQKEQRAKSVVKHSRR